MESQPWFFGPVLTDLIVGFLAGACFGRIIWRVLVWFILPLVVAGLAVNRHALFDESGEAQGWAMLAALTLTGYGFIAAGLGVLAGSLLRLALKAMLPKPQGTTNNKDAGSS